MMAAIHWRALRNFAFRFLVLLLTSYGAFYFSYKWYAPAHFDFQTYYARMYAHPLDWAASDASHVFRQGTAMLTWLLHAAGVYYPAKIAYAGTDQQLFFAALLANYLGLLIAAALAGAIAGRRGAHGAAPLLAGLLCIASFQTQNFVLTGSTEGLTWAFVALIWLLMLRESRWLLGLVLALSIFQREMIVVAFAALAFFQLLMNPRGASSARFVLIVSLVCFGIYLVIRALAPVPDPTHQLSFAHILAVLRDFHPSMTLLFQGLLSQNLPILCLVIAAALRLDGKSAPDGLPVLLAAFAALFLIAVAEGEQAGDVGRLAGMLTPLFAAAGAQGLMRVFETAPARAA